MAGMWEYLNGETMQKLRDQNAERELIDARHAAEVARRERVEKEGRKMPEEFVHPRMQNQFSEEEGHRQRERFIIQHDPTLKAARENPDMQQRRLDTARDAAQRAREQNAREQNIGPMRPNGGGGMSGGQGEMGMMAGGSMGDDSQGLSVDPQSVSRPSPPEKTGAVGAAMDVIKAAAALNQPPTSPALDANKAAIEATQQELRKYSRDGIPDGLDRVKEMERLSALIAGNKASANDIDNYITLQVAEQTAKARADMGASEVGREATKEAPSVAQSAPPSEESLPQQGQAPSRPAPPRARAVERERPAPARSGGMERDSSTGSSVSSELEGLRDMGVRGALGGAAASNMRPSSPKPASPAAKGAAPPPPAPESQGQLRAPEGPPKDFNEARARDFRELEGKRATKAAMQELRSGNPDPSNYRGMGSPNETGYKVPAAKTAQAARQSRTADSPSKPRNRGRTEEYKAPKGFAAKDKDKKKRGG